jgi:hypothetical protein
MGKRILLPKNLDLQQLLEESPPSYSFRQDHFAYIIYLIIHLSGRQREEKVAAGWTALSVTTLKKQGIAQASKILTYLEEELGVIECDHKYKPGEKCMWYRLSPPYREIGFQEYTITQSAFLKRLTKNELERKRTAKQHRHLTKHFNENLTIDADAAIHTINVQYEEQIALPPEERKKNKKNKPKDPYTVYTSAYTAIHKFSEQSFSYNVSDTNKRLNTNFTSIPKIVRPHITYSGEPLANIDLKNSQPFLSLVLLQPWFYETNTSNQEGGRLDFSCISPSVRQSIPMLSDTSYSPTSPLMLLKTSELTDSEVVTEYKHLVCSGKLYDHILKEMNDSTMKRDDVKRDFLRAMYSDNRFTQCPVKRMFRQLFPEVYQLFALFKKHDRIALPLMLQQIEATLILERVTRLIAEEFPDLPIYTIHDSVVTLMAYRNRIEQIMQEEIVRAIGFKPSFGEGW